MHETDLHKLLATLKAQGAKDSEGVFTLDPERAREKLKRFALADPHHYAVHLVAAAVAGGATDIDLISQPNDLTMTFDGQAWSREELEALFTSLFASQREPALVRLRQLAIGLLACMRLEPARLLLESWADGTGARLELGRGERKLEALSRAPWSEPFVTRIEVRERVSWQVVGRLLGHHASAESEAVSQRCSLASVPIRINAEPVTRPVDLGDCLAWCHLRARGTGRELVAAPPRALLTAERPSPGDFSAVLGLPESGRGWLTVVVNGVSYRPPWSDDTRVISAAPWMIPDASGSELVEGHELTALRNHLEVARKLLLELLAGGFEELPERVKPRVEVLLVGAALDCLPGDGGELEQALMKLPMLLCSDGQRVSLAQVTERYRQRGYLLVTSRQQPWPHLPPGGDLVVCRTPLHARLLDHLFPEQRPGDRLLHLGLLAERNRIAWKKSRVEPPVLQRPVLVRLALGAFPGEAGLSGDGAGASIVFHKQGRRLGEVDYSSRFPRGLVAVVDDDGVEPNELWNGVNPHCPSVLAIEEAVEAVLPALYELLRRSQPAGEPADRLRRTYLLERLARLVGAGQDPEALWETPLFELVDGRLASFTTLQQQTGRLGYLPVAGRKFELLPGEEPMVVLSGEDSELLRSLFGTLRGYARQLQDAQERARRRRWWEEHYPPRAARLEGDYLCRAPLSGGEGELGLPAQPPGQARVMLLREGRPLGERFFDPEVLPAGLEVIARHDQLVPDRLWVRAQDGPALDELLEAARRSLPKLYDRLVSISGKWGDEHVRAYLEHLVARAAGPEEVGPVGDRPLFPTLGGNRQSLNQLLSQGAEYLPEGEACEDAAPQTLVLDARDLALLEAFLGPDGLSRHVRLRQASLDESYCLRLRLQDGLQGEMGIPRVWPEPPFVAEMTFLPGGKRLIGWPHPASVVLLTPEGQNPDELVPRLQQQLPRLTRELPGQSREASALAASWELGGSDDDGQRLPPEVRRLRRAVDGQPLTADDLLGRPVDWGALEAQPELLYLVKEAGFTPADAPLLGTTRPVPVIWSWEQGWLQRRFGRIRDVSPRLRARRELLAGLPRDHGAPPPGDYLASERFDRGWIGLVAPYEMSLLRLVWQGRLLREEEIEPAVAFRARLELADPDQPTPTQELERRAGELALRLIGEAADSPRLHGYFLDLLARSPGLEGDAVATALARLPLFPDTGGRRWSLAELQRQEGPEAVGYLVQGQRLDSALAPYEKRAVTSLAGVTLRLDYATRRALEAYLVPQDRGEAVRQAAQRLAEADRRRLARLDLTDQFPSQRWLARRELAPHGLRGEIGLPGQEPPATGLLVASRGVPLGQLDPFPGVGLLGIVDGDFEAAPGWEGPADPEEVRRVLLEPVKLLMQALLDHFPAPGSRDFGRARDAVLAWYGSGAAAGSAAILQHPMLPLPGGGLGTLDDVIRQVHRHGHILFCLPGERPPAVRELVLEMVPTSRLARRLEDQFRVPVESWRTLQPAETVTDPRQRLTAQLQERLAELHRCAGLSDRVPDVGLIPSPTEGLYAWAADGRLLINPAHPAVARLLSDRSRDTDIYFLLPALCSALAAARNRPAHNRALLSAVLGQLEATRGT